MQSRLSLLLPVAEGMLEVSLSQLDTLQSKKWETDVKTEKLLSFIYGMTEQKNFVKTATVHCNKLREIFLGRPQSQQLRKWEDCLKELTEAYVQLLENVSSLLWQT